MGTVTGEGQADQPVEYIDGRRTQVQGFIGQAQLPHTVQNCRDPVLRNSRIIRIGTTWIQHADIRITQHFVVKDAIAKRVIHKPDSGTTAGKMNHRLEQAALCYQVLENGAGRFHIAIHQALDTLLLKYRTTDRGIALDLSPVN